MIFSIPLSGDLTIKLPLYAHLFGMFFLISCGSSFTISSPNESNIGGIFESESASVTVTNGSVEFTSLEYSPFAADIWLSVKHTSTLPDIFQLNESTWVRVPAQFHNQTVYVITLESALASLPANTLLSTSLPEGAHVQIQSWDRDNNQGSNSLIYLGNPSTVNTLDIALALATIQSNPQTAENIATRAELLLGNPGLIQPGDLDPIPTPDNLNYVIGPTSPTLNTVDIAAILSRIQVGPDPGLIVDRINLLLGSPGLISINELVAVPGVTLPGDPTQTDMVALKTPIPDLTFAGDIRIDILQDNFSVETFDLPAPNLSGGTVPFSREQASGSGVTSYIVSVSGGNFDNVFGDLSNVTTFDVPGVNDTCVEIFSLNINSIITESTVCP